MSEITFEYPWVFALGLIFLICSFFCKPRLEAIIFPHLDIFVQSQGYTSTLMRALKWIAVLSALTALASPVVTNKIETENKEGYSIVLALDASGSMRYGFEDSYLASNSRENKFAISVKIVREFIQKRKNDALGLVVFGNFAYVASPLTYDKSILPQILDKLYATIAGPNYTVINDALFQSAKLFEKSKAKSKIVILLTDGQSRGDNIPFDVSMRMIKKMGIKVYTIGIGNAGDFNADFLKLIAERSGGQFFSANNKNALREVYSKIDKLEKSKIEARKYVKKSYLYEFPLFAAFMALLFYTYLLNKRGVA
jgi:Ca-activated chloride channel family protein